MTKQELLFKLATECATWGEARETAVGEVFLGNVEWDGASPNITKQDWMAERERLLNKPEWSLAPPKAAHLAINHSGEWYFYTAEPKRGRWKWSVYDIGHFGVMEAKAIAIPAGYDWKESLEERPA